MVIDGEILMGEEEAPDWAKVSELGQECKRSLPSK
jgi:hypothetical protein